MAKPYTINIVNGEGSENILNGTYSVTSEVQGYDNTTIDPSSITVVEGTNEYSLNISASGTLTIHVTDTGLDTGTPIVGATFIRTDNLGNEYGSVVTTNASGDAVFNYMPFLSSGINVYYKQKSSDGDHEFSGEVRSTSLTAETTTIQIANPVAALRTISLTDKNYDGLKLDGTITLS